MTQTVQLPLWLFVLIVLFAMVTFASHFLFPSVRWFFRRRLERGVRRLNRRLARPIEPFKLARRHDMIQRLIYDPQVMAEIVNYAREHDVPENVAFEKATDYAREIVPSFSAVAYFSFGIRASRLLAKTLFSVRTGAENEARLRSVPQDATVVFVMNHRSNMDYVLVTYLAGELSALSYAVGEWARVWPLSGLIRSMGAYFIRRKSRGALYRKVLARYVQMAIAGGVSQGIFPEGGLSLDGRVAPPKLGLLSYVVDGHEPVGRDVVFMPVAINYDRVLEDNVLIAAGLRGDRRFGARVTVIARYLLRKMGQALRGHYSRFGAAAVVFGEPLSLNVFGPDRPVELLGDELIDRIRDTMPGLYIPLLAYALDAADGPVSRDDLADQVSQMARQLGPLFLGGPEGERDDAMAFAINKLRGNKVIAVEPEGISILPGQEHKVRFYANSIAHHFEADPPDAATANKIAATARL
ncbi:1-acyl-sn-glycerol-3-phosphate acyltransferase [Sulfitobacter sp. D35]|uniref:1-acyl-sn-glycerol-3-phosphate acyltransferase n=1 Tax=Sulfitobacter sp. D35 TaxID=3083252 RepID=UPI00296EB0B6|nr:1-acyl-sn-glycerol-3-phosphate acyltransferase [Sulfitobacter sp. D35]MDW4499083.1 1-acyl-sn-glycerol-3-phosphate acyltransferase [Sulfitobacter sp. D35]